VPISAPYSLTKCRRFFAAPATPRQRQYEALRAFYFEELPSAEVARRFGYSPGAFRVLCHAFRRRDLPELFATAHPGPRQQPKSRAHEHIVTLRKRNYSVYEISRALKEQGTPLSATAVREVLGEEGFAPLPRRLDEERPIRVGPNAEAVANVQEFILSRREFTTRVGGLFLFVPDLVRLDGDDALARAAKLPGSRMIPAAHALRASLALKLWSIERKSHVMALVADEGLALFCGLNAMPKKSFLSEYSSRSTPQKVSRLLSGWHAQLTGQNLFTGQ
jgi:transposase